MSDEVRTIKDRERHERYYQTDAGRAARQREKELQRQGYAVLAAQGVPRVERTPSRCRQVMRDREALRAFVDHQFDECG